MVDTSVLEADIARCESSSLAWGTISILPKVLTFPLYTHIMGNYKALSKNKSALKALYKRIFTLIINQK